MGRPHRDPARLLGLIDGILSALAVAFAGGWVFVVATGAVRWPLGWLCAAIFAASGILGALFFAGGARRLLREDRFTGNGPRGR